MFYKEAKSRTAKLLSFALVLGSVMPSVVYGQDQPFADTAGSYAQKEISSLIQDGIISGYEDNSFRPNQTITRAELAKIIVSSMGLKENGAQAAPFADVAADSWYRGYVGALVESGITQGTSAAQFSPDAQVTREELVVFFVRAFGLEETARLFADESVFADVSYISDWARPHVALAYRMGFVGGSEDGEGRLLFNPKAPAERQALARLAYEFKTNKTAYVEKARQLAASKTKPQTAAIIASVSVTNSTTIEVTFASPVVGVNKEDFAFDNDLTVVDAVMKEGSDTTVVLTTSVQTAGTSYKLLYKGSSTDKTAAGIGSFYGGGGGGGRKTTVTPTPTVAEQLAAGGTLSDVTIKASGTYGPADGSGMKTTVTGTLTVDPGPDGEVTLRNINPAKLDVLSGKEDTIKLQQTIIKQLRVNAINNGGRDVRIEAQDGTSVDSTEVESQAVLESSSSSGKLGTIRLTSGAAGKSLTLKGNIDGDVTVDAPGSTVKLAPPSSGNSQPTVIKNLKVGANSTISSGPGTTLSKVNMTTPNITLNLQGEGTVGSIQVDSTAGGSKLSIGEGTNIESVQADADVTLTGDPGSVANTNVQGQVKVDEEIKDVVKQEAVETAIQLIHGIGQFTVYSGELESRLVKAAAAVERSRSFGGQDADITNLADLLIVKQKVDQLKEEVAAAQKELTIGYRTGDTENEVHYDMLLSAAGSNSTTISWSSSNQEVVDSVSGKVTRPSSGTDARVTLTATITKNGYSITKTFEVTVKAIAAAPGNNPPTALEVGKQHLYVGGRPVTLQISQLAVDTEGDPLSIVSASLTEPSIASVTTEPGLVTIKPAAAGSGKVSVIIADSAQGHQITASFELTVDEPTPQTLAPAGVTALVYADGGVITGSFSSPGYDTELLLQRANGESISNLNTYDDSSFTMVVLHENLVPGELLRLTAKKNGMEESEPVLITVLPVQEIKTSTPTANGDIYNEGNHSITGKTEPFAKVKLVKDTGVVVDEGKADKSGNYSLSSTDSDRLKANQTLILTADAPGKLESAPIKIVVKEYVTGLPASVQFGPYNYVLAEGDRATGNPELDKKLYLPLIVKDSKGVQLTADQIVEAYYFKEKLDIDDNGIDLALDPIVKYGLYKGMIEIQSARKKGLQSVRVSLADQPDVKAIIDLNVGEARRAYSLQFQTEAPKYMMGVTDAEMKIQALDQYGQKFMNNDMYAIKLEVRLIDGTPAGTSYFASHAYKAPTGSEPKVKLAPTTVGHAAYAIVPVSEMDDASYRFYTTGTANQASYAFKATLLEGTKVIDDLTTTMEVLDPMDDKNKLTYVVYLDSSANNTVLALDDYTTNVTDSTYAYTLYQKYGKDVRVRAKNSSGETVKFDYGARIKNVTSSDSSVISVGGPTGSSPANQKWIAGMKAGTATLSIVYEDWRGDLRTGTIDVTAKNEGPKVSSIELATTSVTISQYTLIDRGAANNLYMFDKALGEKITVKDQYGTYVADGSPGIMNVRFSNTDQTLIQRTYVMGDRLPNGTFVTTPTTIGKSHNDLLKLTFYLSDIKGSAPSKIKINSKTGLISYTGNPGDVTNFTINVVAPSGIIAFVYVTVR